MTDKKKEPIPPPLCVWCSAPWTDDMLQASAEAEMETGYYGESYLTGKGVVAINITCGSCKRLVYQKEIRVSDVSEL